MTTSTADTSEPTGPTTSPRLTQSEHEAFARDLLGFIAHLGTIHDRLKQSGSPDLTRQVGSLLHELGRLRSEMDNEVCACFPALDATRIYYPPY